MTSCLIRRNFLLCCRIVARTSSTPTRQTQRSNGVNSGMRRRDTTHPTRIYIKTRQCNRLWTSTTHPDHAGSQRNTCLAEQLHSQRILSKRMELLFDSLSGEPAKSRCPTCCQPYAFIVCQEESPSSPHI